MVWAEISPPTRSRYKRRDLWDLPQRPQVIDDRDHLTGSHLHFQIRLAHLPITPKA